MKNRFVCKKNEKSCYTVTFTIKPIGGTCYICKIVFLFWITQLSRAQQFANTQKNLDLRMKTNPVTAGTDPTIHIQMVDFCIRIYLAHKPNIERCISSNQGRLGLYAEIQIILGQCGLSIYSHHNTRCV